MTSEEFGRRRRRRMAREAAAREAQQRSLGAEPPTAPIAPVTPTPITPLRRRRPRPDGAASPVSPAPTTSPAAPPPRPAPPRHLRVVPAPTPAPTPPIAPSRPPARSRGWVTAPSPFTPTGPVQRVALWVGRLAIATLGMGVIGGTLFAILGLNPPPVADSANSPPSPADTVPPLALGQELVGLKATLEAIAAAEPDLQTSLFVMDLDTGDFVNLNGTTAIAAASTIKLPILIAVFQEVDRGLVTLDESLVMTTDVMASGSGTMQHEQPGTTYSLEATVQKMITISDNTATNLLIERLGGATLLNDRFLDWGLKQTRIETPLPDLSGTNQTSPMDLVTVLAMVQDGQLVSLRSRDQLISIMQQVENQDLLPQGLDEQAVIAHKTGDISTMLGDVGIVDTPMGKRYAIAALIGRPHNDDRARVLIQTLSRATYQYFRNPPSPPTASPSPSP